MFKFEYKVQPVNSEVLVHLKTIESPAFQETWPFKDNMPTSSCLGAP